MKHFVVVHNELAEKRIGELIDGGWGGSESIQALSSNNEVEI